MRIKKYLRHSLYLLSCFFLLCSPLLASDISVFPTGPVFTIPNLQWGVSSQNGINNNFYFTPLNISEAVCVFVQNNNTSNPHSLSASILVSGTPANVTPSDGTWQTALTTTGNVLASPSPAFVIGTSVSGVARVTIGFSGSTVQSGTDTANIVIIQTNSPSCFSGNNVTLSNPPATTTISGIQSLSDSLQAAYTQSGQLTNPGVNQFALGVLNGATTTKKIYFDSAYVSCSAACSFLVSIINTQGNGCNFVLSNAANMSMGGPTSATTLTAQPATGCTVSNPSAPAAVQVVQLAAGQVYALNLQGFIAPPAISQGIEIVNTAALTGIFTFAIRWYEK